MASDRIKGHVARLLDEVDDAMTRLDWEQVRERAQAVLSLDPDNVDATAFLAAADRALDGPLIHPASQPGASTPPALATAPTPDQPTSFADGRYQVRRFLGEGGKKKVYLAHDTTLDREVAFALIKTEGLDETSRTRIQREAQAMGRLGSHPHIVTVFDLGQEQDQPYMVTELMGGGDVEGLIEDAEGHRLPLHQVMGIAVETCRGLEFAHSRGIVHRDLKPGNVWLTAEGIAKIGDFGLAVALDRSRLTTEGMMVGTVSYMPPEQAMGGDVTPRSDLYSLGAMLYEMVTGRPPFLGDDSVAIIGQHINTLPVAPNWHNSECPRALDALILRMLAKDPSDRPESASDVLSALEALDLQDVGASRSIRDAPTHGEEHSLDSLAGGVFVGRQQQMGELKGCLEDALSGRGRLVTLVGEPGIGKSRTAQELATYAGLRGAQVLWGRCYEEQGAPPYWPWVQAIRSYVREKEPEELRSEMGAGAQDIAEIVSDVKERLPGLSTPPQLDPEQARFRLFDSITAFLRTASQHRPLVLVLDDLHWADHPSLLLLEFVARELAGSRLLLVGTYRDMELSRRHPLSVTLGGLTRERLFQRVLLRGLNQEDVGRFIELVSGLTPQSGMVEAVHRQTEGNPLFVTEVVRLLVQEGELSPERAGQRDSWSVRIPEGVREVIGRRLDRLSERCNETLTIASVIGREFTLEHLWPLIEDMTEDRLLEVLEEALAARVIEELPQSVGRYQFTHALIQETLAEELSTTRKVRLHARIAESLEESYGGDAAGHAAELVHHFNEAQTVLGTDRLVRYSLIAGDRALATYAWEEAQAYFQRGLVAKESQDMDAETAAILHGLALAQAGIANREQIQNQVLPNLTRAFDYYAESGEIAKALAVVHRSYSGPLSFVMTGLFSRALSLVPGDTWEEASLLSNYGFSLGISSNDYGPSKQALDRALDISRRAGYTDLEKRALANFSQVNRFHLNFDAGLETALAAIAIGSEYPVDELRSRLHAGGILAAIGKPAEAQEQATAMLAQAEMIRDHWWLERAAGLNLVLAVGRGDWETVRHSSGHHLRSGIQPDWAGLTLMEYQLGNFAEGLAMLEKNSQPTETSFLTRGTAAAITPIIARITGVADQLAEAEEDSTGIIASPSSLPIVVLGVRIGLALIAVHRRDAAASREQYAALESRRGMIHGRWPISIDRVLGLLSQTMGDLDRAEEHFEGSLTLCRTAGYRPELAWTCCDHADALRERDGESDRVKAMALLDESLAISSELGMRPLMERVLSRREILKA